ncbi:MAG: Fur family transcriptional regulator [Acidimicrobiales bacterium]
MKSVGELCEVFRAEGLRITPQRQHIFSALDQLHGTHPTADSLYAAVVDELPTISLKTVYQTLNDLVRVGELTQLDLATGSFRFDTTLDPHHHLVCDDCGAVFDVHADFDAVRPPVGSADQFAVASTEITFRGRCNDCETRPQDPHNNPK